MILIHIRKNKNKIVILRIINLHREMIVNITINILRLIVREIRALHKIANSNRLIDMDLTQKSNPNQKINLITNNNLNLPIEKKETLVNLI